MAAFGAGNIGMILACLLEEHLTKLASQPLYLLLKVKTGDMGISKTRYSIFLWLGWATAGENSANLT